MNSVKLITEYGYPKSIHGHMIKSFIPKVSIGEICYIYKKSTDAQPIARAQVIGFDESSVWLNLIGHANGLNSKIIIKPTGRLLSIQVMDSFLGSIIDATGTIIERLSSPIDSYISQERLIDSSPPPYIKRKPINDILATGIRAIDGLLTCGVGQRMGIFASAGCGKTVLMHMLIEHTEADVFVIGLIGERGREVTECAESLKKSQKASKCVLIYATSDFSSVDRTNAAQLATTVAEYFRDQGKKVVLFIDSMTRYARALRDMKLAAGEPPARRGYPASVFDSLPRLLERPGITVKGSITAFYTVLLEGDDESDPLGDEIRSILDGHIYLSRSLASKGHYPAIDILKSISRVFGQINNKEHKTFSTEIRNRLFTLESMQMLIDLGEYKQGLNIINDLAYNSSDVIKEFLCQQFDDKTNFDDTFKRMKEIVE